MSQELPTEKELDAAATRALYSAVAKSNAAWAAVRHMKSRMRDIEAMFNGLKNAMELLDEELDHIMEARSLG